MNNTYIISKDKHSYQLLSLSSVPANKFLLPGQTVIKVFDADTYDDAKAVYEKTMKKDLKQNPLISHKGFTKGAKRFQKLALEQIDSWSEHLQDGIDKDFRNRFDPAANYVVGQLIEKLIQRHKGKPFKRQSGFTQNVGVFGKVDGIVKEIRVTYTLTNDKLTFKLLTRHKSRFNRKSQFVINL